MAKVSQIIVPRAFTSAIEALGIGPAELVYDQDLQRFRQGRAAADAGNVLAVMDDIEALLTQVRSIVTPEMFGGIADFDGTSGTDNLAALTAAISAASAIKARLVLSGPYYCSAPIDLTNKHIDWQGTADAGFVFGATDGVSISQSSYLYATYIENVDFYTTAQEPGVGLDVRYSASDSINNRNLPRCFINNVVVRGWDIYNDGWTKGGYSKNVHASVLNNIWVVGRRNLSAATHRASFGNMECGWHYDSDVGFTAVPSDSILSTVHVYNAQDGILVSGEVEGLSITGCKLVGVWTGIASDMATTRPGLQVYANHINYFDCGIDLIRQPESQIFGNLLYKFELSDGLSIGIRLTSCNRTVIGQNTHTNSATDAAVSGNFDCVRVIDSTACSVEEQSASGATCIVRLQGTTQQTRVRRQVFTTATYANSPTNATVIDETGNFNPIADRWAAVKSGALTVTAAGVNILSVSMPINVRRGQRFRVDAILAFTKGGTAGNINYSISKSAGSAGVSFFLDATSFGTTSRPDAGTQANMMCSAEMTVLSDGNLQLTMAGISAGSDAAIAAGGAQIVVTEMG